MSICMWLGPCLSVRLREVSVSGGSTVKINNILLYFFYSLTEGEKE